MCFVYITFEKGPRYLPQRWRIKYETKGYGHDGFYLIIFTVNVKIFKHTETLSGRMFKPMRS